MTRVAPWLWLLLGLFAFRVGAQLVQWLAPVSWLPAFEAWHGDVLAYPLLLAIQLALLVLMTRIALRHTRGAVVRDRRLGRAMLVAGCAYAAVVAIRVGVGASGLSDAAWFHRPLPSFFHAVLATWVLLVGAHHARGCSRRDA